MVSLGGTRDLLHLFGDPTRVRLVALLARHRLTVAELVGITQVPQSRVSTHLARLREAGVVRDRRNGTSSVYGLNDGSMPADAARVWALVQERVEDAVLEADRTRAETLVRARQRGGWPDAVAGEMERHYSPGRTWEATAHALPGLMRLGDVLDAGSGDGTIAELLAPRSRSFTCLDRSERMLRAAGARLSGVPVVRIVRGDVQALPAADGSFDHVLLLNVLASVEAPQRAFAEAARVLRRGGDLTVVTLEAHRHAELTATYGHVHPGFRPATLRRWLAASGLGVDRCAVTSRERREPHFSVLTAFARKTG